MDSTTKVLIVADTYHPKVDGTLMFMDEFYKRAKKDFELSYLVPKFKGSPNRKHISFFEVSKWIKLSGYNSFSLSLRNFSLLKEEIKKNELIFVQGPALASYLAMYYGRKYDKLVVTYIHVITWELFEKFLKVPQWIYNPTLKLFKKIMVWLYNRCDLVLAPYNELRDTLQNSGVTTNVEVAKLGVDIERFHPTKERSKAKEKIKINHSKTVIGYVGRVSQEKNVMTLVKAFKSLPHQDSLHLLIVGDGEPEVVNTIKKMKNCSVTSFVRNVEDYLQAMDIFVMPSLTETTSLATLEAMASGLPVIATKVGYIKEYISKDYNGVFFPRENASHLGLKLQKLIEEPHLRERLGKNARKTIAYSFSWERSINKIKRILTQNILKLR